jgi:uncharacterized protein (DUF305 family)
MAESKTAMTKMMTAMDIRPSGDADAEFVAMMVPCHQGTIDLAQAQLHHGRNEQLSYNHYQSVMGGRKELSEQGEPCRRNALTDCLRE